MRAHGVRWRIADLLGKGFLLGNLAMALMGGLAMAASSGSSAPTQLPSDTTGKATPEWADDTKYEACGQACLYQKGNESISLRATYVLQQLAAYRKLLDDGTPSAQEELKNSLAGFCSDKEIALATDGLKMCLDRYTAVQTTALLRMRNSIGKNETAAASLTSKGRGVAKSRAKDAQGNPVRLKMQLPEIISEKDVIEDAKLQDLASEEYDKWARELPVRPVPDDFIQFKKLKSDDPDAPDLVVVDDSEKGKANQMKAYKAAMAVYEDRLKQIHGEFDQHGPADKLKSERRPGKAPTKTQLEAFQKARRLMLDRANAALDEKGYAKGKRQVASSDSKSKKPKFDPQKKVTAADAAASTTSTPEWDRDANDQLLETRELGPEEPGEQITVTWGVEGKDDLSGVAVQITDHHIQLKNGTQGGAGTQPNGVQGATGGGSAPGAGGN